MISLDKAVIARYSSGGLSFEAWVDPEGARKMRADDRIPVESVVASLDVYSDARKGTRAAAADLNKVFGTADAGMVIRKLVRNGEIQLTTEQKRKMQEERKKQVLSLIARTAVDPRTHAPHPLARLELAFEESRVHIDPMKSADEQAGLVLDHLKKILPIRMETNRIAVKVPAELAAKVYGMLKQHDMSKEEWGNDGSLMAMVTVPAGLTGDFLDHLNKLTQGNNETRIIEKV
ncbi:ribosome assembly factor SBDS [Candidatus Micrarchaeota archaeon]|nr:ribosome assembly factor SBDS [Candidatus Micrarchaeota archaeon]